MNKYIAAILFLFTVLSSGALGQDKSVAAYYDSSNVELRKTPGDALDEYRNDNDFKYIAKKEKNNFVGDFLRYLYEKIIKPLLVEPLSESGNPFSIIVFIVIIAGLAFLIFKFAGGAVLKRNDSVGGTVRRFDPREAAREDLAAALKEAADKKQYREAVRYHYLIALRELRDRELIRWKPDRTNLGFAGDITNSALRLGFLNITSLFEYVWYGEFAVDGSVYKAIERRFSDFSTTLEQQQ